MNCDHGDIQICEHDGRRCIACFACGRLFGWLDDVDYFAAYNPPALRVLESVRTKSVESRVAR